MRIIIAGGREFNDIELLERSCHDIFRTLADEGLLTNDIRVDIPNMEIVCGKARGADTLGEDFGKRYGIKIKYFPANWDAYGKSAGYIRNKEMAKYAKEDDCVLIAFWDKKSKGTKHMIDLANNENLRVFVINY
jgi:hypothetical protein